MNLKTLLLNHNSINEIKGLNNLVKLRTLYLENNNLKKISGLEFLVNLEVLHLNENDITEFEGLDKLEKLQGLSTADTSIPLQVIKKFKEERRIRVFGLHNKSNMS